MHIKRAAFPFDVPTLCGKAKTWRNSRGGLISGRVRRACHVTRNLTAYCLCTGPGDTKNVHWNPEGCSKNENCPGRSALFPEGCIYLLFLEQPPRKCALLPGRSALFPEKFSRKSWPIFSIFPENGYIFVPIWLGVKPIFPFWVFVNN